MQLVNEGSNPFKECFLLMAIYQVYDKTRLKFFIEA